MQRLHNAGIDSGNLLVADVQRALQAASVEYDPQWPKDGRWQEHEAACGALMQLRQHGQPLPSVVKEAQMWRRLSAWVTRWRLRGLHSVRVHRKRAARRSRLLREAGGSHVAVTAPELPNGLLYHAMLSYTWNTGQDQVMMMRQCMLVRVRRQMAPPSPRP